MKPNTIYEYYGRFYIPFIAFNGESFCYYLPNFTEYRTKDNILFQKTKIETNNSLNWGKNNDKFDIFHSPIETELGRSLYETSNF